MKRKTIRYWIKYNRSHLENGRRHKPTKARELFPETHDGVHHHDRLTEEYRGFDLVKKKGELCCRRYLFHQFKYFLFLSYLWNPLKLANIRDSKTKEEIHEYESHDQDEDEEEDLGDERCVLRVDEVRREVKFSHQHRQHLKDSRAFEELVLDVSVFCVSCARLLLLVGYFCLSCAVHLDEGVLEASKGLGGGEEDC